MATSCRCFGRRVEEDSASVDICKFNAVWLFVAAASVSLAAFNECQGHTLALIYAETLWEDAVLWFFGLNVIAEVNSNVFVAQLSAV